MATERKSATVISLATRRGYRPDMASLACQRIVAARQQAGLTRAAFAAALQSLLRWTPPVTEELIKAWETTTPPSGQVVAACEIIAGCDDGSSEEPTPGTTLACELLLKSTLDRDDLRRLSDTFDAAIARAAADDISRLAHVWLIADAPQSIELRRAPHQ